MKKHYRPLSILFIFITCLSQTANAEEAYVSEARASETNTSALAIEEVWVSAQRREEKQQKVPISIGTLSGEDYDAFFSSGEDIQALANRITSLYVESSNGRIAPRFYIRGLGNVDFDLAASQPVSIIFDEVVQENVVLKSFPLFDIEQVEVIRGPQGSLFGRNTTAGIVKFRSRKPSDESNAYARASYGTFNSLNIEGAVGGTLVEDKVFGRISLLSQNRQDWIDNAFTEENNVFGGYHELAGRAQLLFTPNEDLSILLNYHARDLDGSQTAFRANVFTTGSNDLNQNYQRDTVFYDGGDNNTQKYKGYGTSLKIDWNLDDILFTSVSALEKADGSNTGDIDGGVAGVGPGFIPFSSATIDAGDIEQFTQELRLANDNNSVWNWQAGVFYFDSELSVTTDAGFNIATVNHQNTAWAVFTHNRYQITSALELSAGIRYTDDEREFNSVGIDNIKVSDNQISWDIGVNYSASNLTSVYTRIAEGFRAATIQGRDVAFFGQPSVADSETIRSYEIGLKSNLFDHRLHLNAALFYYTIDGLQLSAIGGASNSNRLLNADKGVGQGFEVDIEALATQHLKITAGFSYNDTEIKDDNLFTATCGSGQCTPTDPINESGNANINGNPFQGAPKTIFNFTLRYQVPLSQSGFLYIFTDWSYQGETHLALYESKEFITDDQYEGGLRLGYKNTRNGVELAFFARNITDEDNVKGFVDFNNNTGFVNEPRIFGVEVIYNL